MKIIGDRPPGDQFSFDLFSRLVSNVKSSAFYCWSLTFSNSKSFLETVGSEMDRLDTVFLCIRDHFTFADYNFTVETKTDLSKELEMLANKNPLKTIVLFTALEHLDRELGSVENIKIVRIGGDITNHRSKYMALSPVLDKNFDSNVTFISLNRGARFYRVAAVSMMYEMGLHHHGNITFLDSKFFRAPDFLSHVNWTFAPEHAGIKEQFIRGFPLMRQAYEHAHSDYEIYYNGNNDNVGNFNKKLRAMYQDSFVEVVSETSFTEPSFLITEKTLNSIYGCNFPIFLAGLGCVELLREMGMDVFDDIIDHSYDCISDPLARMHQAIVSNREILTNGELAKTLWADNQERFIKNLDFARDGLYNYYINRAAEDFSQATAHFTK